MLDLDLEHVAVDTVDLFVTEGRGKTPEFGFVRIDNSIREALVAAASATWKALQDQRDMPELYDSSNSYPSTDYLYIPLLDPWAAKARYIHDLGNPDEITNPLKVLPRIRLYAARIYDRDGRRLMAVKTTSNFGRMLEKGFWARLSGQELSLIEEPKFQLSSDFDFLIDSQNVIIYRHAAFESACNLKEAITDALVANIEYISQQIPYIDFASIEAGVSKSIRAAREMAAIRAYDYGMNLSRERLISYCDEYQILYSTVSGKISIDSEHHMLFLQLLARKILGIQLRDDGPEVFAVSNRKAL